MEYFKEIMIFLAGAITGGGAVTFFKFTSNKNNISSHNKVSMKNVSSNGDISGRDINKK